MIESVWYQMYFVATSGFHQQPALSGNLHVVSLSLVTICFHIFKIVLFIHKIYLNIYNIPIYEIFLFIKYIHNL